MEDLKELEDQHASVSLDHRSQTAKFEIGSRHLPAGQQYSSLCRPYIQLLNLPPPVAPKLYNEDGYNRQKDVAQSVQSHCLYPC